MNVKWMLRIIQYTCTWSECLDSEYINDGGYCKGFKIVNIGRPFLLSGIVLYSSNLIKTHISNLLEEHPCRETLCHVVNVQ